MGEKDQCYIYLFSSVKSLTGVNTVSHFTTSLPAPIILEPGLDYEAAAIKIIYPTNVQNVYNGEIKYYSYALRRQKTVDVPLGEYVNPNQMAQALNAAFHQDLAFYRWTVNIHEQKFMLECRPAPGSLTSPYVDLSKNLQAYTGIKQIIDRAGSYQSEGTYDTSAGHQNLLCFTDLIEPINVGDTFAPIIFVGGFSAPPGFQMIEHEVKRPIYTKVNKTSIQTIRVEFRNKIGDYFPFMSGETMVLAHIRACKPRL